MKRLLLSTAVWLAFAGNLFGDPQLTSWLTAYSGQYARIYGTTAARSSGTAATTWANQSVPAYADIAQVLSSSSTVYVRAADLPSYVIGPWLTPQGTTGQFSPTNQHLINFFPRSPSVPSGTKTISGTGYSGLYVNGVAVFNFTDGKAWDGTNIVSGPHNQPTYFWHRTAPVGEGYNFDYALGHQNPAGVYHTHQQPIALRYQLGDHVNYNPATKNYSESSGTNLSHSPIIGWAYDGYPIYGPYGYSISNDASSGVRRMVSGYVQRDGTHGTDSVASNLTTIPAWYARFRQAHFGGGYSTVATTARAPVAGTNLLGTFGEDFSYYGDLTNAATGRVYFPGTNTFDLDVYNGRYCVTPDYPGGTYAYFLDLDSNSVPAYPYAIAYEYYGAASGGSAGSIPAGVTTNFLGGPDANLTLNQPTVNSNYVVSLVWSSTEGGTYLVESSTNSSTWTTQKSGVAAAPAASSTATNYTSTVTTGTGYVRVSRTALATYDAVGGGTGVVGQTNVQPFQLSVTPPTVANPIANQTATYGAAFSYTFPANTFAETNTGLTLTYAAAGAALTNTGISFNSATRTFSATTVDATSGGQIAGIYSVAVIATDSGAPAQSATNVFLLTIGRAAASVTPNSVTRGYGAANPPFTGTTSNFVTADSITANYSTSATTGSPAGVYAITATLNDPGAKLGNYSVTTNTGTLTITNAGGGSGSVASFSVTNSVVALATNLTLNYSFTNASDGSYVTIAVTTTPLSLNNASPGFDPLDFYGPGGSPVHVAMDSGNGDGNWIDDYESVQFSAALVAASSSVNTATIQFGIGSVGIRSVNGGALDWTSPAMTTDFTPGSEALYPLDSALAYLTFTGYSGLLQWANQSGGGFMQLSDATGLTGQGIVFNVTFSESTNFALGAGIYAGTSAQSGVAGDLVKYGANGGVTNLTAYTSAVLGTAFDAAGNLYVCTSDGNILKYTTNGASTLFAGNLGTGIGGNLAFDGAGNLYFSGNDQILKFSTNGNSSVFASGLASPAGLAFDQSGNLYVACSSSDTIQEISAGGTASTFVSYIDQPAALAFDGSGNLFATATDALSGNDGVWKFSAGGSGSVFATSGLVSPDALAFDRAGNLYAGDATTDVILEYASAGGVSTFASGQSFTALALWPLPAQLIPPASSTNSAPTCSLAGYANGQFQFTVSGTTGGSYLVQAATNLAAPNWISIWTNAAPFTFTDASANVYGQRYYRARISR
jgi:hypothetical protein